jgi:hypothetical protein
MRTTSKDVASVPTNIPGNINNRAIDPSKAAFAASRSDHKYQADNELSVTGRTL